MSDPTQKPEDELAGTEQPFVTHLMELRDRLVRAMAAIGVAAGVLALFPGPGELYDLLAAPLVSHLPAGTTLIATSVISPFYGAAQNIDDGRFFIGLARGFVPSLGLHCARFVHRRKALGHALGHFQHLVVFHWRGVLLFLCVWTGL